ncbi:hypothetical protein B0H34DRAFT_781895 [Crassisporium funariophilum]|nr:hypothetical protein B0H34DRAFT_781895 [Crassisporium funariophilum]
MEPLTPNSMQGAHSPVRGKTFSKNVDVERTQKAVIDLKKPLENLAEALGGLHVQTMQIANLDGQVGTKQEINDLRNQLRNQDHVLKNGMDEIQDILDKLLKDQVVSNMRKQVEKEIADQIDELVKEHVAECLRAHIPQDLRDEVAESKHELEQVRLALNNSESRRANGNLRSNKPDDLLGTIYMTDGKVSPHYPKDLKSLFSLNAESTDALMKDYELPNASDSRDHNLNRFMQFCGVRYQLVE